MKKILSICKPSYNRFDVLVPDIKEYLSIDDDRLIIKVNDNCSINPEIQTLKDLACSNENVILNINNKNEGPIPNFISALSNAPSDYVMLLLDKDTIDIRLLPEFIDYLEKEKPNFGFIDLGNNKPKHEERFKAGYDAISNVGYLRKHPSGYFWRADLLYEELDKPYFKEMDPSFDFPFGAICGSLASRYDATILYWPLIINETMRVNESEMPKTKSYNDDNFYFGKRLSIMAYKYFYSNLMTLNMEKKERWILSTQLTNEAIIWVTISLRSLFRRKNVCDHYNLTVRKIGFPELLKNTNDIICLYKSLSASRYNRFTIYLTSCFFYCKSVVRSFLHCAKDLIVKPKEEPLRAG